MTIQKRLSKKGNVSYLVTVNLGYKDGKQVRKGKTWKPNKNIPKSQIKKELYKWAAWFEKSAKEEYKLKSMTQISVGISESKKEALIKKAVAQGESVNELINSILDGFLNETESGGKVVALPRTPIEEALNNMPEYVDIDDLLKAIS